MTDRNLTCHDIDDRLGEYLAGTLDVSSVADVELHLSGCVACSALVRDFERIVRDAAALPTPAPSRDLWPAISARLATPVVDIGSRSPAGSAFSRRLRTGALAAGLVGLTATVTYSLVSSDADRRLSAARDSVASPVVASITATATPVPGAAEGRSAVVGDAASLASIATPAPTSGSAFSTLSSAAPGAEPSTLPVARRARLGAKTTYDAEISALRGVLGQRSQQLDPRTVAVLQSSLSTIDSAIAEARRALINDPASHFLSQQLNKALERKLGLLRTAALLPART